MYLKKTLAILVALVMAFGLLAVAGTDVRADVADEIIVAQGADPASLDPHGKNEQPASRVRIQMFETLVNTDAEMNIHPGLAESWEQIDEQTWEFKLREGVLFHNGEELTANDVLYTFARAKEAPEVAHIVAAMLDLDACEALDTYTVRLVTTEPFGPMLTHLAHPAAGAIVNEKATEEAGDEFGIKPVGTGPFKFVSWDIQEQIVLERYEDYWGEPAKTQRIVFRPISENTVRTIELETGAVHIAYDIPPNDVAKVEENDALQMIRASNFSTTYVGFNCAKEPFDDVRVRQAINYAVNMDEIVEAVYKGTGSPAKGALGPNVRFSNQDLEPYEYDPDKAIELLAEAGYGDGDIELVIWTNDNQLRVDIATMMVFQLSQVGITASQETVEWGAYLDDTAAGKHDLFILGWTTVTGDADYGLYALFHSSQHGEAGNRTFYTDERVDELLDEARAALDEDRGALYYEAQQIIRDDAPWIFTWTGEDLVGADARIDGFELHPAGSYKLAPVSLILD